MKKICIIHPEGNINNNPNLTGIVEILCEKGYDVDIYSPKNSAICQFSPCSNSLLILEDLHDTEQFIDIQCQKVSKAYDFIIGVDRLGVVDAAKLSEVLCVPYGMISYEFAPESNDDCVLINTELKTLKKSAFIIISDKSRSEILSNGKLDYTKFIYIPVAGRALKLADNKSSYLHDKFSIPYEKKIALVIGGICSGTMIPELIRDTVNWPEDWVLLLHGRYGRYMVDANIIEEGQKSDRVYFSFDPIEKFSEMNNLLHSSDLGIGLYKDHFIETHAANKNIRFMGLSSGKTSTYLQHELPVLISDWKPMSALIKEYKCGFVIKNINQIRDALMNYSDKMRQGAGRLFEEKLDLNKTISPLLEHLSLLAVKERTITSDMLLAYIKWKFEAIINEKIQVEANLRENIDTLRTNLFSAESLCKSIKNSNSYKIGNNAVKALKKIRNILPARK